MRIRPEQLQQHLAPLKQCYCLHGEEPLILQELAEAIRAQGQQQGFLSRDLFFIEGKFRWQQVIAANQEQSLFASQKIIELRIPSGKPGQDGSKALLELSNTISPDNILLLIAGKIESAAQKSSWYKALDKNGVTIPVFPLAERELFSWINQRARTMNLDMEESAIKLLAARTEGNLLATTQALEKFTLMSTRSTISTNDIDEIVSSDARFTRFQLVDAALNQDFNRAIKILNQLQQEGTDVLSILNSFVREARVLNTVINHPQGIKTGIHSANIWPKNRERIIANAASNHTQKSIQSIITLCLKIDKSVKGLDKNNYWILLSELIKQFCMKF